MADEWTPEPVIKARLDQLRREFLEYIEKNIDKIDANIPVFYGHVIATLEKAFPGLSDDDHDDFIDAVTVAVLEKSKRSGEIPWVEKLFEHAIRNKHRKKGRAVYDIMLGIRMINSGRYMEAAEQLKKYRNADALICPMIAYCYFVLSTQHFSGTDSASQRPNEMALAAREQMIELVRLNPPVNRLKDMEIGNDPAIDKIFWFMLNQAITWFSSERGFLRIGIDKATKDNRPDIKEDLLNIAVERFYSDMYFLRELYRLKLEKRDAGGVAGVIKQMAQQYPDDIEPIYYGIKLSIITARKESYSHFRKLALLKNMPAKALLLLDFAFEMMSGRQAGTMACLEEIRKKFGQQHHYVILLDYVMHDFLSGDERRVKQAKKAMIDSVDQYCVRLLKIAEGAGNGGTEGAKR